MIGVVKLFNQHRGMAAVELDGGFSVFEILEDSYSLELGDIISGPLESSGGETVQNITKGETMNVSVEDFHCDRNRAIQLLQ